jgi:hypothetical protein
MKASALLKEEIKRSTQLGILSRASRFGHDVARRSSQPEPSDIPLEQSSEAVVIGMGEISVSLGPVRSLVKDDTGHTEACLANYPEQLALKTLVNLLVSESPEDALSVDEILAMETNGRVVRMPVKDIPLEIAQCLGESSIWDIRIEPRVRSARS